jgi:DNA-binding PucR family transcriptional regulator
VRLVILNVDLSKYSLHSLFPQDEDQSTISDDAVILGRMEKRLSLTDDVRAIRRAMKRLVEADVCHFRFDRWVDNLIVAIGQLSFDGAHAPAEPAISVEIWVDRIRQYVRAINAWIDGKTVSQVKAPASIIRRVYALLGEPSAAKIWLAASLSKTMRSIGESFRPSDEPPPDSFKAHSQN